MEIKTKYLNMVTKNELCKSVANNSITERDGMKFIDYISKVIATDLALIEFYTDMDINNMDLDSLYENETIETIKSQIPTSELNFIISTIDNMIEQEINIYNSISGVINRQLNNFVNKIPDEKSIKNIIKSLPKAFDKISPDNLEILKAVVKGDLK